MEISRIGVAGAGLMGGGIAQMFAEKGFTTRLWDVHPALTSKGVATIRSRMAKSVEKGTLTATAAEESFARLRPAASLAELADAGLVIEAIFEDAAAKKALLEKFKPKPHVPDLQLEQRRAERELELELIREERRKEREQRRAVKAVEDAKQREEEELMAEARELALRAAQKAARDARYAARKQRRK